MCNYNYLISRTDITGCQCEINRLGAGGASNYIRSAQVGLEVPFEAIELWTKYVMPAR